MGKGKAAWHLSEHICFISDQSDGCSRAGGLIGWRGEGGQFPTKNMFGFPFYWNEQPCACQIANS